METLAVLPLAALLGGVLLQIGLGRWLRPAAKGWLAFASGLAALGGVLALIPTVAAGGSVDALILAWDRGLPFQLHVDALGLVFGLMATGIGAAILLYCVRYMEHEPEGLTRFYALMLTFIAGLVHLVFSANLLLVYLSWEVIGLCSYFLVGFWYRQTAAANGARKVLLMTHLPGYALLVAILLLYTQSGTFLWTDPQLGAHFSTVVFLLMLAAAMAKSVLTPLHTWIPEAMNAPTPVSALLHSACYVKAGIYLIARLYSITSFGNISWPPFWNGLILALGCLTMLVGALFALAQTDLKRLLAFSTISQLGYIVAGLGLGTPLGVAAGLFYCLSHGLFKGTLFLCAGAVQHSAGTRDLRQLGGLAGRMPVTAGIWMVATASIIGVPLTNGFVAKWLLFSGALEANQWLVVLIAWLVSVLTAFYMLKATVSVFFGEMPAALAARPVQEAAPTMRIGMGFLAGLTVLFGIAPQLLMNWVVSPAVQGMGFVTSLEVQWFGLQTGAGSAPVTVAAGLVLAAVLLSLGWVGAGRRPGAEIGPNVFSGGDPLTEGDRFDPVDFADLAESNLEPVYQIADPDPLYRSLWNGIKAVSERLNRAILPAEQHPYLASMVLALLVLAALWLQ